MKGNNAKYPLLNLKHSHFTHK